MNRISVFTDSNDFSVNITIEAGDQVVIINSIDSYQVVDVILKGLAELHNPEETIEKVDCGVIQTYKL